MEGQRLLSLLMHNSPCPLLFSALATHPRERQRERWSQREEEHGRSEAQAASPGLTKPSEYVVSFATLLIKLQEVWEKTFFFPPRKISIYATHCANLRRWTSIKQKMFPLNLILEPVPAEHFATVRESITPVGWIRVIWAWWVAPPRGHGQSIQPPLSAALSQIVGCGVGSEPRQSVLQRATALKRGGEAHFLKWGQGQEGWLGNFLKGPAGPAELSLQLEEVRWT